MTKKMLARFRADPAKVRVGVRYLGDMFWQVTVSVKRVIPWVVTATSTSPNEAVMKALKAAERQKMPGIDLGMGWTYDHPMGLEATRGTVCDG